MANLFERLNKGRPSPTEEAISARTQEIQHAQRILNWLQHWDEPIVRSKDLRIYGPRPRDRESVLGSARILVENGWLRPIQTRRYDAHVWHIVRRQIVRPVL
jgi:hypothetical protein